MEKEIKPLNPLKIILIILLIIIVIVVVLFSKHQKKELITTPELIHLKFEDTIKNNILFSDIRIDKQEEYFYITSKATNIISNNLKISPITITLEDNQSNKLRSKKLKVDNIIYFINNDTCNCRRCI